MTCKELQAYWESDPRAVVNLLPDSIESSEHLASCPECSHLIEEKKEVAKYLHLVRSSAPAISASLDSAVLARYRDYVSERSHSALSLATTSRLRVRAALAWAAALASAVIVAYGGVFLFIPHQRGWVDGYVTEQHAVVAPQVTTPVKKERAAQETARKMTKTVAASAKHTKHRISIAEQDTPFPTRFQSLMYCDQLSCPGAMEVIHVQLVGPILRVTPAPVGANSVVSADVLVGADGIARGIRVVE